MYVPVKHDHPLDTHLHDEYERQNMLLFVHDAAAMDSSLQPT